MSLYASKFNGEELDFALSVLQNAWIRLDILGVDPNSSIVVSSVDFPDIVTNSDSSGNLKISLPGFSTYVISYRKNNSIINSSNLIVNEAKIYSFTA